ncbi:MAG: winged helix-turn-helix transcriptional regulator [Chloroflexi bacterium]|nr:winged helix-turn-helix transcriptional regulator [Chloroflexota bacterium]MBM4429953.1 winged helix-turn-helix transcriptional regulator [Chloroflexota bacterium]
MTFKERDSKRIFQLHANICRTLSHPTRLEILDLLRQGECSVSELAERIGSSLANISQHLAVLRNKGVVVARREGVNIYYQVSDPKIIQACNLMREVLLEQLARSGELAQVMQKRD